MNDIDRGILAYFRNRSFTDAWGAVIDERHVSKYLKDGEPRFNLVAQISHDLVRRNARVLEVGPAYGSILLRLRETGYDVTGAELEICIPAYSGPLISSGVPVIPWDMHMSDCPLSREHFELVVATEVLEHLQMSLPSAIRKLSALLAPGGALLLTTPNVYSLSKLVCVARGQNIVEPFPDEPAIRNGVVVDARAHPREPTMRELVDAVRAAGLTVERADYFDTVPKGRRDSLIVAVAARLRDSLLVVGRKS